jgi:DNA-binding NtrC family response regulator
MARSRQGAAQFNRLLDESTSPVYALDARRRIVYCNEPCLRWLNVAREQLLGQQCDYHSQPESDTGPSLASGLCPPPEALAGEYCEGIVAGPSPDGRSINRHGHFIPLHGDDGELIGVVAMLSATDARDEAYGVPTAAGDSAEPTTADLHQQLRAFRAAMAARFGFERLIGGGAAMTRARARIELAATSSANVLIEGPPGSGKEHVAKTIHYRRGADPQSALVPLACAELQPDLVLSTVDALRREGARAIEQQMVTLLLHDVDQLPAEAHAELRRLLRPGRGAPRAIATTTRRLSALVRRGEFAADLAYELSTLVIRLPALATRLDDLPLLAQMFLEDLNARGGKQLSGFTPEALDALSAYPWTGNLDELAVMVREAHQNATTPKVGVGDLPTRIHLAADAARSPRRPEEPIDLEAYLARVERELIERALQRSKNNKAKAARLLGMTRPRLYRRLVQLGFEQDENEV